MLYIIKNNITKQTVFTLLTMTSLSLLTGCVTQSFENNEPIVKTQANRDEMAATRISLGLGYLKMGDMPQAKLNLEKAKGFSPQLVQVHTAFAHYYETVGENTLAIEAFEEALVLDEDSADTLNNYGVFLCRQGEVDAAEVQFLKAIAVPSYLLVSESYENLSSCYLQNDDFDKAQMYLQKSIFHSPNRTSTLLQMVRLQYAMGNYKDAKKYLQKFERNTQRFTADSLSLACKLYRNLGERRTSENYGNMLVKMYPQSWEGKQYLLNQLEYISADDLADRYQREEKKKGRYLTPSSTKRVVKLSPKGNRTTVSANAISPSQTRVSNYQKPQNVATSANNDASLVTNTLVGSSAAVVSTTAATTQAVVTKAAVVPAVITTSAAAVAPTNNQSSQFQTVQNNNAVTMDNEVAELTANQQVVQDTANNVVTATEAVNTNNSVDTFVKANQAEQFYSQTNDYEPTSTQPIAAKRDAPLPEAFNNTDSVVDDYVIEKAEDSFETRIEPDADLVAEFEAELIAVAEAEEQITTPDVNTSLDNGEQVSSDETIEISTEETEKVALEDALHTVLSGQNLYNISVLYNVKLDTLRKWNDISESNNIRIGDKLYVVDPQTVQMN